MGLAIKRIKNKDKDYKSGLESYSKAKLPVFINNNVYYNGAKAFDNEVKKTESLAYNPKLKLVEDGDRVYLHITLDQAYFSHKGTIITSEFLGKAKIPNATFENRDGTSIMIDEDFFGALRAHEQVTAGPFSNPEHGELILQVW